MRLPVIAVLSLTLCMLAAADVHAATAREDHAPTLAAARGPGSTPVVLVADEEKPEESGGGGGFVTGLSSAGLGCLIGVLPSAFMGFMCGFLGAPCAFPCLLIGTGGGALLGAGIESGFDGAKLFAPTLIGGLVGGGLGLIAATAGVITAFVVSGTANTVNPSTGLSTTNATAVGIITGAVVGGISLVGALGSGIGAGIAYALSGSSDEAEKPVEIDATPPEDTGPAPIDQPKPEDSQPPPDQTAPDKPADPPPADDPDMKGFFY